LAAAAHAFDAIAPAFDARFGAWKSVTAQRRAVRAALADALPVGARVLEIGGGTGEDACWLASQGRTVLLTDPSPAMVRIAGGKLMALGQPEPRVASAENLDGAVKSLAPLDGAFSNFAALNCVADLAPVAASLARLVRVGGRVVIVVFGTWVPGEWVTQVAKGEARSAFRRLASGDVTARVGGSSFEVRYHRDADVRLAFASAFRLRARRGIGVFVPPSAAEPWISTHPGLLGAAEWMDRFASRPLALLGDHVLYDFERVA
jgi:SAM-dependent methyltransferase